MISICLESGISIDINNLSAKDFVQFALDASSMNLKVQIDISHPALTKLFKQSRELCYAIDRIRTWVLV